MVQFMTKVATTFRLADAVRRKIRQDAETLTRRYQRDYSQADVVELAILAFSASNWTPERTMDAANSTDKAAA